MRKQKSSIDKVVKKESEASSFKTEMFTEAIVQNPVLVSTIGLCPVVAISTTLKSAILLSVITYLTMIFSQVLTASLLKSFHNGQELHFTHFAEWRLLHHICCLCKSCFQRI